MKKIFAILAPMAFLMALCCLSAFADGLPVLDKVSSGLSLNDSMLTLLAGVVGMIFRVLPTKKPLSIAYFVAAVLHQLGGLFEKLGALGDKILPQNIAPAQPEQK
jgi:hypothetical protein